MNEPLIYIDRKTSALCEEKVYHGNLLNFLYLNPFGRILAHFLAGNPLFSRFYGWLQNFTFTRRKIAPFVKKFGIDSSEFELPMEAYPNFNAFFTRKLKKEARPLGNGLIAPADGRYLFYENLEECDSFVVKGKKFVLNKLIEDEKLAKNYLKGSMVIIRLCPSDYHRFHFPCDCIPSEPRLINGPLYSVNPIAIKQWIDLFTMNKRMITQLKTQEYGNILFIEVGATCVGSIHQTYTPGIPYKKGDEKGYFSFGGSSIILLFQPGKIQIDSQLLTNSSQFLETLCLFGQTLENKN